MRTDMEQEIRREIADVMDRDGLSGLVYYATSARLQCENLRRLRRREWSINLYMTAIGIAGLAIGWAIR